MQSAVPSSTATLKRDLIAGGVVFVVALPLCLGIALASDAPLFSGIVAGLVGGILVGMLSGSQTSVSGPAAGLTAVVAAQIATLGSFEAFLLAVVVAGIVQIGLGVARAGFIAAYFPSSVIKGLLAAIGVILILKQLPHLFGHDADPEGEMSFFQPDHQTTFSELGELLEHIHPGASLVGLLSLGLLILWDKNRRLKGSGVPAPMVVVVLGVVLGAWLPSLGAAWAIGGAHLVQVPVAQSLGGFLEFFSSPDFSQLSNPAVYSAGVTIAVVASLETLLNLEAVDKLDPQQRRSPASRELLAQGIGNVAAGMLGGIPMTSVIVRSSVNVGSGGQTRVAAIFHGVLLFVCVLFLPTVLNRIPLSCLAAILLVIGFKLASPVLMRQMWDQGPYQFIPFASTMVAIVLTDILVGVLIGLAISISFILKSNVRVPIRRIVEKHLADEVVHVQLADQVSFLKRAALAEVLDEVRPGGHLLLDARTTDYIDPDVLAQIRDYQQTTAPARSVQVSLIGFKDKYELADRIQFVDYSTRELQTAVTGEQVLEILRQGHLRFLSGTSLASREYTRQVVATAQAQHPLGVILSCIDSRVPTEVIFDMGVGDVFSVRVAGNISSPEILGSMEYGCAVAGAKLILVLGHTRCGAVTAAVDLARADEPVADATGCQHIGHVIDEIQRSFDVDAARGNGSSWSDAEKRAFVERVVRDNVLRTMSAIPEQSTTIARLVREGHLLLAGAVYDVATGDIQFLDAENPVRPTASE